MSSEPSAPGVPEPSAPAAPVPEVSTAVTSTATPSDEGPGGLDPTETLDWRRVHPVTPAIRSWKVFVGIIALLSWQFMDNVDDARDVIASGGWRWVLLGIGVIVLVATVYSALAWRFTRFAVGDEAVHFNSGILFRQQRQARLDRLQSIDVVRPLLARLAGLSQLTLEVAGANDSKVELAYLRDEEAAALRAELLAKAAGIRVGGAAAAPLAEGAATLGADAAPLAGPVRVEEAPERTVLELPLSRLLGSIALSGAIVGFVVFLALGIVGLALAVSNRLDLEEIVWSNGIVLLPAVLGLVSFGWSRFSGGYGFRAAISPDGIRLSHGLLETRAQTIAPGRVQAIELIQPVLWRKPGWWRVRMNVAGYGLDAKTESSTTLLPVGDLEQALLACWLVLPDLGTEDAVGALTEAMHGSGDERGFTLMSQRVRWIAPFTYRRHGYLVTERALVLRQGRLRRVVQIVPHERTQSLGTEQGLLARALRVAAFTVHSVAGPVRPALRNLDYDVAIRLMDEQSARAREARALDRSERWMEQR